LSSKPISLRTPVIDHTTSSYTCHRPHDLLSALHSAFILQTAFQQHADVQLIY